MVSNYDSTLIKDSTLTMSDREVEEAAEKIFKKSAYEYGHGVIRENLLKNWGMA